VRALIVLALTACVWACSEASTPAAEAPAAPPAAPVVHADSKDLVFSYADPVTGTFATTSSIGAIPEAARASVTVTDLSRSPEARQAARYMFVADLRAPGPDGSYPVAVASRHGNNAKPAEGGAATSGVVLYTTSWCGVCKQTKSLLKRLGVPFTEKDIEASRSAAEELAGKARKAGISTGGVPVIDVGGIIMQGLDEVTLRRALQEKGFLKG